jgi:hypothetical protein
MSRNLGQGGDHVAVAVEAGKLDDGGFHRVISVTGDKKSGGTFAVSHTPLSARRKA